MEGILSSPAAVPIGSQPGRPIFQRAYHQFPYKSFQVSESTPTPRSALSPPCLLQRKMDWMHRPHGPNSSGTAQTHSCPGAVNSLTHWGRSPSGLGHRNSQEAQRWAAQTSLSQESKVGDSGWVLNFPHSKCFSKRTGKC